MRTTDIEMILETYDEAENKVVAINNLANMLHIEKRLVVHYLQEYGRYLGKDEKKKRDVPKTEEKKRPGRPKAKVKKDEFAELAQEVVNESMEETHYTKYEPEEPKEEPEEVETEVQMPEFVRDILENKLMDLEEQLEPLRRQLEEKQAQYEQLKEYLSKK